MALRKAKLVICILFFGFVHFNCVKTSENVDTRLVKFSTKASCSLENIPSDTSPTDPYTIEPISDKLKDKEIAWIRDFVGSVNRTATIADEDGHYKYVTALWGDGKFYTIRGNNISKTFVRTFNTRLMVRNIRVYCIDGTTQTYYLRIPVHNLTPPKFSMDEYTFHVPVDWNISAPISQENFVIVSDDSYEIEENNDFLKYSAHPDILRIEPVKLWVQPFPEMYHFQLDIYLKDSSLLKPNSHIQVGLSARNEFYSGSTLINIIVEE